MTTTKKFLALFAVAAIAILSAGCGDDDDPATDANGEEISSSSIRVTPTRTDCNER